MKKYLRRSNERGHANHGWLDSWHSFSFAGYYDPAHVHFGLLRVLNDDVVVPSRGFGTHPHADMEIISIVLDGALTHRDSMGHQEAIKVDEVQVMSAGTGVEHSEFNASNTDKVNFLQLWIFPRARGLQPRYGQKMFPASERQNKLQMIVSPDTDVAEGALYVQQDAWLARAEVEVGKSIDYTFHKDGNGLYLFVIDGEAKTSNERLGRRDALGIWETDTITVDAEIDTQLLFIEVPMV